ncbi:MAG: class II aldolase/adducin family protein [Microbacteriaceae bacterium]|nr:class II aldolase/adducin family protein [Microbacteriaceae bacterium]
MTDPAPLLEESAAREAIVEVGRRLWQRQYVSANDGNVSVRIDADRILCTPTMTSKGWMEPSDLAIVRIADGEVLDRGTGRGPSSEVRLHLGVYRERPDIGAVVHAHPMHATAFAIRGEALTALLMPESVVALPRVPLARYATPSTDAVPESIHPFVRTDRACLLEQHGAIAWDTDLESAYLTMERIEYSAQITLLLRQLGGVRELDADQVAAIVERFGLGPLPATSLEG